MDIFVSYFVTSNIIMEELFQNKYRIKSTRLKHWDYSSEGFYYITICTKNRESYFGNNINGKIKLSKIGEIIQQYWNEIPNHYEHVSLDEFIIMPNHLHGIIVINKPTVMVEMPHWVIHGVETIHELSLRGNNRNNKFQRTRRKMLIPKIIGKFKMQTSKIFNQIYNNRKLWQPNYYETIIRNEKHLHIIRKYIKNNPLNWNLKSD